MFAPFGLFFSINPLMYRKAPDSKFNVELPAAGFFGSKTKTEADAVVFGASIHCVLSASKKVTELFAPV